ncbi:primosomal protein N' [Caminicella sporogenes]|uniref:primosomal protein N' n=1 Tax=Caminicella sporogenes TaxID=166485 RepID=UPI002540DD36|nr:primosomal protein N' [Caminicella sporogenes]WIF94581.1 primosomal protein N' [Caminicella sporogenes]
MYLACYAGIVVNTGNRQTDNIYTYRIPQDLQSKIKVGCKVVVPFGIGNKLLEGYVFEIKNETDFQSTIKDIKYIIEDDIILSEKQIKLCHWLKNEYLCTYFEAISLLVPSGTTLKRKIVYSINYEVLNKFENLADLTKQQKIILNTVKREEFVEEKKLKEILNFNFKRNLNILCKMNLINSREYFYTDVNHKYKKMAVLNFDINKADDVFANLSLRAYKQRKILEILIKKEKMEVSKLISDAGTSSSVIKQLEKKGLIRITEEKEFRSPLAKKEKHLEKAKVLNREQKIVYDNILKAISEKKHETFLVHGVTGSGKTEVYIQLVDKVLKDNKQAIILVPEISLTTQIVNKFFSRFGANIAVLHSKLSLGERLDQWKKIKNNEISIVIGARSAVFAPCENLGIIIIDEEHESSYKSDMSPKYQTVEVAKYICTQENIPLVLGTATPSVESYYKALKGQYRLLKLKNRFNKNPLPTVEIVDMRVELEEGNRSIFSKSLYNSMKECLANKKQVILFLNRRGFSTFISCRSCGFVLKCINCDISLTYHYKSNLAKCHYCGYSRAVPDTCPSCGSKYIKYFGAGTEKVEKYVKKLFPNYKVQRLDVDTTSRKGELERIITSFENREIDILIGTQMVTKGLDFPYVTLVGVLSADTILNLPDYRANERTFQLLTQVAGRAGRHDFQGKVIIQTYTPENFSVIAAQSHDYDTFFKREINIRREFLYPPFCSLINIVIYGKNENDVIKSSRNLFEELEFKIKENNLRDIIIFGPNPAIYNKIKGNYRWQILIKCQSIDQESIKGIINNVCIKNKNKFLYGDVNLSVDINPYSMF